jgi:hypothetical protein
MANLSAPSAQELRAIINANLTMPSTPGGPAPAPVDFCTVWPTAKPVIQFLAGVIGFIPGVGAGAGAALIALTAAGQSVYDHTCGGGH